MGYKDPQGKVKIEPQYDFAVDFVLSYGIVLKNDSVGALDKDNNIVIPIKYQFLRPVDSSDFLFGCKAKYLGEYYKGIITKDQEVKVPAVYRDIIKR